MLTDLKLRDFRCFERLELELTAGTQFFVGDNAQGKTSILEAACVLLRLASPRSSTLGPLIHEGARGFSVQGNHDGRLMQSYFAPERRKLVLDAVEQSGTAEYLRLGRVVYFSNTDLDLVRGSGDSRRRYLDFLGGQIEPIYRTNLRAYERALRSRNRLLKAFPVRWREVEAYDGPLVETGSLLTDLRRRLVAELEPWIIRAQGQIRDGGGGAGGEGLALEYHPGAGVDFAAALAASRDEESRLRQTVVGPHRDDLRLMLGNRSAAVYGSEGNNARWRSHCALRRPVCSSPSANDRRFCCSTTFLGSLTLAAATPSSLHCRPARSAWWQQRISAGSTACLPAPCGAWRIAPFRPWVRHEKKADYPCEWRGFAASILPFQGRLDSSVGRAED